MLDTVAQAETSAIISAYIDQLKLEQLARSTLEKYAQNLRYFRDYVKDAPITEYIAKSYLAHLRDEGYSHRSVELYYHAIKPFLASLGIQLRIRFKKQRHLPQYHSLDQIRAIVAAVENRKDNWSKLRQRDALIIYLLAYTGIRRAELLGLRVKDFDRVNTMIRVCGKGDKERVIPVVPKLAALLSEYVVGLKSTDFVVPLTSNRLYVIVRKYATAAGVPDIHPHSFRHFFATQLNEQGVQLNIIRDLLGHADISTTAIYLDMNPKHLQSAVNMLPDF